MAKPLRVVVVAILICLLPVLGVAQNAPTAGNKPKLGLVLEGGGALGLAHIGVIQYLEEHHIPVSYIAGTSMGGLVGGVYATGRNAKEVREVVQDINWDQVIAGRTAYDDLSFRRKQDERDFPSKLEFGLRKGLQFPSGFNSGQQVDLILDRISLPYSAMKTFNDLPIPFACVATDLVERSEHVFRSGPLEVALRSTMSLPGIFSPVHYQDHIYVDGGLLNNIPVAVAKEMGADITLGVHLQIAGLQSDAALSSLGVLGESIAVMINVNERAAMKNADVLITVPLEKYTGMDYNKSDELIKAGYEAAGKYAEKLAALSVDDASWQTYLSERTARRLHATVPQFVEVTGVSPEIAKSIAKDMSVLAGKSIESNELDAELLKLNGLGAYSSVTYAMVEKDGKAGLRINAEPKPYSPPIIRPLISINGADYNEVFFSMGARITFLNFGGYRREWRNDVMVGSQYELNSEYYRPFNASSKWFVAPRLGLNSTQFPLYNKRDLLSVYRDRTAGGGLDVGYGFGRVGELRVGYEGGYERLSPQLGSSNVLPTVSGGTADARIQYTLNKLDDPVIPHQGSGLQFTTKYFNVNPGAPHGFTSSELRSQNFFKISDPSSVFINGHGGTTYGANPGIPQFPLSGLTRFVAYGVNELLTNQYWLAQVGYIRTLKKMPPLLGTNIDFLGMFEVGKTYQLPHGPRTPSQPGDVVGALIVNTIFGPVEIGGAVGNYGHAKIFFQVGRIF